MATTALFETLPASAEPVMDWTWPQIAPFYDDLTSRALTAENVDIWLADWSRLASLLDETDVRFTIATTTNTADEDAERRYATFLDGVKPQMLAAEQRVKEHLLASGLEPQGFAVPLRKLRTDADLFREANSAPLSELRKLSVEYEKISGSWQVEWEGKTVPLVQLFAVLEEPDRDRRERAWKALFARILADDAPLTELWRRMITTRQQIATNADLSDFRAYRWRQLYRFDYTPDDAKQFLAAIEQVAVPAASRIYARRKQQLGVPTLRHWDTYVDPLNRPPLRPYTTMEQLETGVSAIFKRVDPQFSAYFETMRAEHLLDLDSRANKAPGGYSLALNAVGQPFIYTNSIGTHGDVQTMLHEGGHAFHAFEMTPLPYLQLKQEQMLPMEYLEVPSTAMELLGSPYLTTQYGGFYTEAQAARARLDGLTGLITFWPYMAIVDGLQHWMYEHPDESADLARCDDTWAELVDRYWPDFDWTGVEREKRSYWHMQSHIFTDPFYYIEYGMAQLGAVQIWANMRRDPQAAVAAYRRSLALGGSVTLPELYAAAGARFAFDADTLRQAVDLLETAIAELEPLAQSEE